MTVIVAKPLTRHAFAPFGDVIAVGDKADKLINEGRCRRYHDLAQIAFDGPTARGAISVFQSDLLTPPWLCSMMERHPQGSQAFLPMTADPFLVVVAPDDHGRPDRLQAFLTAPGQGVNYHRNIWHGVLTPLSGPGLFAVVDRIGPGDNLEEHWFDTPFEIIDPNTRTTGD